MANHSDRRATSDPFNTMWFWFSSIFNRLGTDATDIFITSQMDGSRLRPVQSYIWSFLGNAQVKFSHSWNLVSSWSLIFNEGAASDVADQISPFFLWSFSSFLLRFPLFCGKPLPVYIFNPYTHDHHTPFRAPQSDEQDTFKEAFSWYQKWSGLSCSWGLGTGFSFTSAIHC